MQKKKQKNYPLVLDPDDQIIAEFTNYLSITLRNARIKYLKKWTKIRKFECSIEDLELDSEPFTVYRQVKAQYSSVVKPVKH